MISIISVIELTIQVQTRTQSLFKCFFGVRRDWGSGQARAGSHGKGRMKNSDAIYCAFLGSSLEMDSNVQPGVGKFGCN